MLRLGARHPESIRRRMDSLVRFNRGLGLRKRLEGVGWSRVIEYSYAAEGLAPEAGQKLLDIGAGKHSIFALWCAATYEVEAMITDLTDDVRGQELLLRRLPEVAPRCTVELQDATRLPYGDGSFDIVSAISAIEHIPEGGDSKAMKELHRVLVPGGRCAITVPFSPSGHKEVFRRRRAYDRSYAEEPVFFQHKYDHESLKTRILNATPLEVASVQLFGETNWRPVERWNRRMPLRNIFKYLWGWRLTSLASRSFRPLDREDEHNASIAVAVLTKGI